MTTATISGYEINGVIDTSRSALDNIETIAAAARSFFTFDVHTGRWCVIINRAGTSVASFNNSNILGAITVSGSGITDFYNRVRVTFPNKDLFDLKDSSIYKIDNSLRYENEPDNTLEVSFDIVNNIIQAEQLALTQLKQSRLDKIIRFQADFSQLQVKAGDIIDVTNSIYGFTNKLFRVINIEEVDSENGSINLGITASEYDANVYDYGDQERFERSPLNGIIQRTANPKIKESDDKFTSAELFRMLGATMATNLLISSFTRDAATGLVKQVLSPKNAAVEKVLVNTKAPLATITGPDAACESSTVTLTIALDNPTCYCTLDTSTYEFDYTITGVLAADINKPLTGKAKVGSFAIVVGNLSADKTLTFTIGSASKSVTLSNSLAFTYVTTASPTSITEGASSTVTLTTTGVANGTSVPYTITGTGTGRVSTALTGNVTVNSNSATLTVATTDDGTYTGTQSVTVTFNSAQADNCGQLDKTAAITILDNDTAPPADTTCEYVSVPVVWCGIYDGTDNQLKGVSVLKSAMLPKALAGEATHTVPLTLTVTKGNPSTITVATTTTVASASNLGGSPFNVIYSFSNVDPKGLIRGSHYVIYGYSE
jgi:hypothetical protein